MKAVQKIVLDPFCYRQFDKTKTNLFINYDKNEFAERINKFYIENTKLLQDGYAPFCKHLFVENFTDMTPGYVEINDETYNLIDTCYEARTEKELPVLRRYIPLSEIQKNLKTAKYLDIILYSKEQIQIENAAMGNQDPNQVVDYDYGIISVKPQNENYELPMDPITMMRNALGIEHGGSGVAIDKNKYTKSVDFWSYHVLLK
jgi:hypothetical protein